MASTSPGNLLECRFPGTVLDLLSWKLWAQKCWPYKPHRHLLDFKNPTCVLQVPTLFHFVFILPPMEPPPAWLLFSTLPQSLVLASFTFPILSQGNLTRSLTLWVQPRAPHFLGSSYLVTPCECLQIILDSPKNVLMFLLHLSFPVSLLQSSSSQ